MLIGVKETPAIARRVYAVEVDGTPVVYAFRAMLGPAGWCDAYYQIGIQIERQGDGTPYGEKRYTGHTRAWVYGRDIAVQLTPDLVTLDWEIDEAELVKVEAAMRQGGGQ